jgi:hypothetical protein
MEESKMTRMLCLTISLLAAGGIASAEQYWITYEGNDLPENEGWNRSWGNDDGEHHGDGAYRTVEDGILTMDSLYDLRVYDYAYRYLYGEVDPNPGELFIAEWRMNVEENVGDHYDAVVTVASDDAWQLSFGLFPDHVESIWEDDVTLSVAPGVFHEYCVRTWDMRTYELYIDGNLVHEGTFWQGLLDSKLAWGDGVSGAASLAHWDYVHFGVVPEPSSALMLMTPCVCAGRRRECVRAAPPALGAGVRAMERRT